MLKFVLLLVAIAAVFHTADAFFDFLKSPATKQVVQHVDTNAVRGAPAHLHSRYLADPFVCDGKVQKQSIVNDGYCDCLDKSDEPGTSACGGTVFHCINEGYKMIKIPSSRVDDQVCDCCDGSDEGRVASCPNTCNEAAERERAQLFKVANNYKIGSATRAELIRTVTTEKAQQAGSVTPLGMEIHRLREDLQTETVKMEEKLSSLQVVEDAVMGEQRIALRSQLNIAQLTLTDLAHCLSNLLKVLKVKSHTMVSEVALKPSSVATADPVAVESEPTDSDDEEVNRFGEDHGDDDSYENEPIDIDTDLSSGVEAGAVVGEGESVDATGKTEENACKIVALTEDSFLEPLCSSITSEEDAINAIVNVVLKRRAFNEVMLILGYHQLHQSFIGSDVFVTEHVQATPDACPASFEPLAAQANGASFCGQRSIFSSSADAFVAQFGLVELRNEVEALRSKVREINVKISDVEKKLSTAESASTDMEKYKDHLEYLAMKDQCFDKEDGAFTYSLCILGSITQKEVVGSREVTLGTFTAFEPAYENTPAVDGVIPSVIMKFGNGQHCHAFGARTATVTVSCAAKNALISATEPSTCAYKLHFESPAACTPKYAEISGISAMRMV